MKLSSLVAATFSGLLVATAAACSTETIIREAPAPDAGLPEAGADEDANSAMPSCTPGAATPCSCPSAKTGQQTCTAAGASGVCECVTTPLDKHTDISKGKTAIEAETHLAVSKDGTLCAAWIAIGNNGSSDIGYVFSHDGGATWTTPAAVGDASGRESSDPVVATDAQGNFYATWIAFQRDMQGNASDFVLYVAKAPVGQDKFSTPVAVDTFVSGDKPWITVTAADTILVTYMTDSGAAGGASVLNAQRSVNGGAAWTKSTIFTGTPGGQANFVIPCAPKTGTRVWATHLTVEGGSSFGQRLHWSDDDGATWPAANTKLFATNSSVQPASCAAKGSDVWVAYGQWTKQPATQDAPVDEYHVMHTTNGTTLDDAVASDAATLQQVLGAIVVEDATGELALTYYAGDSDGSKGNVRSVRSKDAGKTWGKSTVVSAPLTFTADRASPQWLGDYLGTVLRGGALYMAYGENSGQLTHVAFSKTP
jgi:hypothetical protein